MARSTSSTFFVMTAVLVVVICVGLQPRRVDAGPGSGERKSQRGTIDDMCKRDKPNNATNFHNCPLSLALQNICNAKLNGTLKTQFQAFIYQLEKSMATLTKNGTLVVTDAMVVTIAFQLKNYLEANPAIGAIVSTASMNFNSSGVYWGQVQQFWSVAVMIQFEVMVKTKVIVVANGTCPMVEAIRAAANASGNSTIQDECDELIEKLLDMLEGTQNDTDKLALLYQIIITEHVELIGFLKTVNIPGFGSMQSLIEVSIVYYKLSIKLQGYFAGPVPDCPFMEDLESAAKSCGPTNNYPNKTTCANLVQIYAALNKTFLATADIQIRFENVSSWIFQFCGKASPWVCGVKMPSCGCTLYDIMIMSNICHNEGNCDCMNNPPPTLPPCTGGCEEEETGATTIETSPEPTEEETEETASTCSCTCE